METSARSQARAPRVRGAGAAPGVTGEEVSPALAKAGGVTGSRVQVIQGDQHNQVDFR